MQDLCCEYVSALTENIDNRFQHSLPVVESFRIFDPVSIPPEEGAELILWKGRHKNVRKSLFQRRRK